ncbi:MAG: Uma2 family endonuclease [Treponema sp.]|nr:Uma2 family endonuclease [Treponema sp.]
MADPVENIERYTYADYTTFPEDMKCELINGIIHMMSSPSLRHQRMVRDLTVQLSGLLEGKHCEVMVSPFDVRLFPEEDNSDNFVVIPDLSVICDPGKLADGKACRGAPDFIIEILSPATMKRDLQVKKQLYEKAGVRECWFIDQEVLYKCILENGSYSETELSYLFSKEPIQVIALPGISLTIPADLA